LSLLAKIAPLILAYTPGINGAIQTASTEILLSL
jgi:hypothetical protein